MMVLGREVAEPIDLVVGLPQGSAPEVSPPQYVIDLRERLEVAHEIAREVLGRSVKRAKRYFDRKAHERAYKVGDQVWLFTKGRKRVRGRVPKFMPHYEGPFLVKHVLDSHSYVVQKGRSKLKIVHHDDLKPYHGRDELEKCWADEPYAPPCPVSPPAMDQSSSGSDGDDESVVGDYLLSPTSLRVPEVPSPILSDVGSQSDGGRLDKSDAARSSPRGCQGHEDIDPAEPGSASAGGNSGVLDLDGPVPSMSVGPGLHGSESESDGGSITPQGAQSCSHGDLVLSSAEPDLQSDGGIVGVDPSPVPKSRPRRARKPPDRLGQWVFMARPEGFDLDVLPPPVEFRDVCPGLEHSVCCSLVLV